MIRFLLIFILMTFATAAGAASNDADSERKVGFDWEPLEGASSYDVEIGSYGQNKATKAENSIPQSRWTGLLAPGKYWIRVRARDERNVPGEWSDKSELSVKLPKVDIIRPSSDTVLNASGERLDVLFEWKKVAGAKLYELIVESEDQRVVETRKVPGNSARLELPAMTKYKWFVKALDDQEQAGERENSVSEFTIEGPALLPPTIAKPETVYVRQIEFERDEKASGVDVRVKRYNPGTRDWKTVKEWNEPKTSFVFPTNWPGGKYQVSLRTTAPYRAPSSVSEITFDAFSGPRTAENENRALIRKSLERTSGWFTQVSYIVTKVQYKGVNYGSDSKPKFDAFTGTAVATIAKYWDESPFGVSAGFGWGGILLNSKNTFLFDQQVSGVWRTSIGAASELRASLGLTRREIPEAFVESDGTTIALSKLSFIGTRAGGEYWHALDRKLGLQGHGYYTLPLIGTSSSGAKLDKGSTLEFGAMSSYRWSPEITALAGYTYVSESFSSPGSNAITGRSGSDEIALTAHYLHFMVEYDF